MAWSVAGITDDELAAQNADKPLLCGQRVIHVDEPIWSSTNAWPGTLSIDGAYPIERILDGYGDLPTRPLSSAYATWYILFHLDGTVDIDTLLLLGHNFDDAFGGCAVTVEIADDSAFTVNLQTIYSNVATTTDRICDTYLSATPPLGRAPRYSGVEYLRITLSAGALWRPEICEIVLGRRRQLLTNPNRPWDKDQEQARVYDFVPETGSITRYIFALGQGGFDATWDLNAWETDQASLESLWVDIGRGTRAFVWVKDPYSGTPKALWVKLVDPRLYRPQLEGDYSQLTWRVTEQPPFLLAE